MYFRLSISDLVSICLQPLYQRHFIRNLARLYSEEEPTAGVSSSSSSQSEYDAKDRAQRSSQSENDTAITRDTRIRNNALVPPESWV